jgi:glycosyltransferase involved in cell wall biosynthesis|tara:strand:+ start:573 stop:1601 length:1029 start_codon:yes stop_codon:yes gene_type:complete
MDFLRISAGPSSQQVKKNDVKTLSEKPEQMTDNATDRPLVTFALFAYNQEEYIREAVEGAFAQTYEPLEIILSDDYSSDRTFEIMQEMAAAYDGSHDVKMRRNPENLGLANHFNRLTHLANGDILTVAAGDDISRPERVSTAMAAFEKNPYLSFVECGLAEFSDNGPLRNYQVSQTERSFSLDDLIANPKLGLVGAGRSYKKDILQAFPALLKDCPTEDSTCILRCLLRAEGFYDPTVLVERRLHDTNISTSNIASQKLYNIRNQYHRDLAYARQTQLRSTQTLDKTKLAVDQLMTARVLRQLRREGHNIASAIYTVCKNTGAKTTLSSLYRALIYRIKINW